MAQKHLILILARELASNLATPTLIADEHGNAVFYNEAAEAVMGTPFAEGLPGRIALDERREAHVRIWVTSRDGVNREVSVTAFPLFAHADEFVGIVVIFWRE